MYKQGDIVWVPYPLADQPGKTKVRPAIIISNASSNALDNDMLIAQITSVIRKDKFSFRINNSEITTALPKESEIRCNKIATIRNSLVIGKLSSLKPDKHQELVRKIFLVFE